jgi:hypothetical protein
MTSQTDPAKLRSALYQMLIGGGKGIAFYKDPLDGTRTPLPTVPAWDEFPQLRREIDRLMPLIRRPHWTAWTAAASRPDLLLGTRDLNGEGYLFAVNLSDRPVTATATLKGMDESPSELIDFFTGKKAGSLVSTGKKAGSSGERSGTLSLPSHGTAVYRLK